MYRSAKICLPFGWQLTSLLTLICLSVSSASARGDTLMLKGGGRVDGQIMRRPTDSADDKVEATYVMRVGEGMFVRMAASEVGRVVETTEEERQYQRLLPQMPDTAAGHETMANWCQEHNLMDLRKFHWGQVLRHDLDHAEARRILGYSRIRGKWTRAEDFMQAQGYVRYNGRWRLPQTVAREQQNDEVELAQKAWRRDIRTWRSWLNGRRQQEGIERLQAIDDPLAATGLAELMARESDPAVRQIYVDVLARLSTSAAIDALTHAAIYDDDLELRLRCADYARELAPGIAVRSWTRDLRHRENRIINRAAVALGRLGHPDAIRPLIGALVTQHEALVKPAANIRPTFGSSPDGSSLGGLSVGGGPRKVRRSVQNKSVLEALVALTDQNHRYSETDWHDWYIQQHSIPDDINLRRD